ncbi:hypothetical protein HG530_015866 [Fusarium avenaceum]|nr:hypothetical protein HG530_015866 [Fusarium avenaceum]
MESLDLIYSHSALRILICKWCKSVFATSIRSHIRTFHRELALSKQELKKYEESFRDLSPICDRNVTGIYNPARKTQQSLTSPFILITSYASAVRVRSDHMYAVLKRICESIFVSSMVENPTVVASVTRTASLKPG